MITPSELAGLRAGLEALGQIKDRMDGGAVTTPPRSLVLLHGFASSFDHNWRQTGWVDILSDFDCSCSGDRPARSRCSRPLSTRPRRRTPRWKRQVFQSLPSPGPLNAVGFSAGADLLLRLAIAHPGHFERIALLGLGDNVFETRDASTLALALESDDEPEDVQARLFYRLAVSSGNDRRALAAFIRRPRPAIAKMTCRR